MKEESICIFGDSIVWGAADTEKQGWVNRLAIYCSNNLDYNCFIYNLGIPGETTTGLLKRLELESSARMPTKIVIAIGTNDARIVKDTRDNRNNRRNFY